MSFFRIDICKGYNKYFGRVFKMNKKRKFIILIFVILFINIAAYITYLYYPGYKGSIITSSNIILNEKEKELADYLDSFCKDAMYRGITTSGDYAEYYTLYFNLILNELKIKTDEGLYSAIKQKFLSKDFYDIRNSDFYFGVEKLYFIDNLIGSIKNNYHIAVDDEITKKIKSDLKDMICDTYISDGYFLPKKYNGNKDVQEDIKLMYTTQTLELAKKYNLISLVDRDKVKEWLLNYLKKDASKKSFTIFYKIFVSLNGIDENYKIDSTFIPGDNILASKIESKIDLIDMRSYVLLNKIGIVNSSKKRLEEIAREIKEKIKSTINTNDIMDPEMLYTELYLLRITGEDIPLSSTEVNKVKNLINSFQLNNGLYSGVVNEQVDYVQTCWADSVFLLLNKNELIKIDPKGLKSILNYQNICRLIEEDQYYMLYSLLKFDSLFEVNCLSSNEKKKTVILLLEKQPKEIDGENIESWSKIVNIVKLLAYKFQKEELPKNTDTLMNKIISDSSLTSGLFKVGANSQAYNKNEAVRINKSDTLLFLDTVYRTGLYEKELINIAKSVKRTALNFNEDVSYLNFYYKYMFLYETGEKIDLPEFNSQLKNFESSIGYSISSKYHFFDLKATYLLIQLNNIINQRGTQLYEYR